MSIELVVVAVSILGGVGWFVRDIYRKQSNKKAYKQETIKVTASTSGKSKNLKKAIAQGGVEAKYPYKRPGASNVRSDRYDDDGVATAAWIGALDDSLEESLESRTPEVWTSEVKSEPVVTYTSPFSGGGEGGGGGYSSSSIESED